MKRFRNFRLITKLLLSYALIVALPFSLSSFILGRTSTENIKKNTLTYISLFTKQISSNIDSYISELDRMTKVAVLDTKLFEYLTVETNSAASYYEADQYLSGYMLKLMTQQPNIQTVTFIGKNGRVFTGTSNYIQNTEEFVKITELKSIKEDQHKLYLSNAHIPSYLIINSKEPIFCVVKNLYSMDNNYTGSIILNIVCKNVLDVININPSLLENGARIIITNSKQQVLADTSEDFNYENLAKNHLLTFSADIVDSQNMIFSNTSEFSGLTTTVIIAKGQLFHSTETFNRYSGILTVILMIVIFILAVYFSFQLLKPVKQLQTATEECAKGNYDILIPIQSFDEIGMLCSSFNIMAAKIKYLMERVYLFQLQSKQAQLEALQNQINPHFLHNTLETIRMKALINKDREVAGMIKLLARLFRITLDHTQNIVTLQDELEHVQTYIDIQNLRFDNRFHLNLSIVPELKDCSIIKLSLQPIVENCIVHGFSQTFDNEAITINAESSDSDIYITISDNGKGIDKENLERILNKIQHINIKKPESDKHNSIGIINISERILLEYGSDYYLDIKQNIPNGTKVIIKIPKNKHIPLKTI